MDDEIFLIGCSIGLILCVIVLKHLFHETLVDSFIIGVLGFLLAITVEKTVEQIGGIR